MRARHAVVLLLLAVLTAAAAWLAYAGASPLAPVDFDQASPAAAPGEAPNQQTATTSATPDAANADPDAPAGAREQMAGVADGDLIEEPIVRVLRRDEHGAEHAVAGATVAWVAEPDAMPRAKADGIVDAYHLWPMRYGARAKTDADGAVRLPPVRAITAVSASGDGLFAVAIVDAGEKQRVLYAEPDETIAVEVRTAADAPAADVPLAIRVAEPGGERELWRGRTDAEGRAQAPHFQILRPGRRANERFFVGVVGALAEAGAATAEFAGRPAPTAPILLRVATMRPLAVDVRYADGAPVRAALDLFVGRAADGEARGGNRFGAVLARKPDGADAVDVGLAASGAALPLAFAPPPTPTGERAQPKRPLPDVRVTTGAGPATASVRLPDDVRALSFTLHDDAGQPLAAALLWQLRRDRDGALTTGRVVTDRAGRGELLVPDGAATDPTTLTLQRAAPAAPAAAATSFGPFATGERRDLGVLVLQPAPLLAAGRVVDDRGVPRTHHVEVVVQVAGEATKSGAPSWSDLPTLTVTTDADGAFAIHAPAPPRAFRLFVGPTGDCFAGATEPLVPGSRVDIVTPRAGVLTGQVVLPAGLPAENVLVQLLAQGPHAGAARPRNQSTPLRRDSGWFWLGGLHTGDYALEVRLRNVASSIARVPGVRIAAGDNADPRLSPLDLSTALHRFQLRAVDAAGAPRPDALGFVRWRAADAAATASWTALPWRDGAIDAFLPTANALLLVCGPGAAPRRVQLAAGAHDVVVADAQPVTVLLAGVRAAVAEGRALELVAEWRGEHDATIPRETVDAGSAPFGDDDRATLRLARSGRYALSLRAVTDPAASTIAVADLGEHELTTAARGAQAIAVDPARVAKALGAVR